MHQLVIINRDGVINEKNEQCVLCPEQWEPLPGALEAIARLNHAGVRVAVISAPSKTPEDLLPVESINRIHAHLQQLLARRGGHIDAFFIHTDTMGLNREATMEAICDRFSTTPQESVLVTDISDPFGKTMDTGSPRILIGTPDNPSHNDSCLHHAKDLMSATDYLLNS